MNSLYGKFTSKEIETTETIMNEKKVLNSMSENIITITELPGERFLVEKELEEDEHQGLYPTIIGIAILSESKKLMN